MNEKSEVQFGTFEINVLSEKIVQRILKLIREKQLKPGDRLPPERELAAMMQVSRPSLREALRALSIMGVIYNRQGSGTFIASQKPVRVIEQLNFILAVNDTSFLQLTEARRVIESGIAQLAAKKISDEQLQELKAIVEQDAQVLDDPEAFLRADLDFHNKISEVADNQMLSLFMQSLTSLSIYSRERTVANLKMREQTVQAHRKILTALTDHDPEQAAEAMKSHLDQIEDNLKNLIGDKSP